MFCEKTSLINTFILMNITSGADVNSAWRESGHSSFEFVLGEHLTFG